MTASPAIDPIVFVATPDGFAAMRNENLSMPLDLKTVLTLVDGVCPVAQYKPFLSEFAPLEPKFLYLERKGFIRRLGSVSPHAVQQFQDSVMQGMPTDRLPRIDADAADSSFLAFEPPPNGH
jgi:hypothetical protein